MREKGYLQWRERKGFLFTAALATLPLLMLLFSSVSMLISAPLLKANPTASSSEEIHKISLCSSGGEDDSEALKIPMTACVYRKGRWQGSANPVPVRSDARPCASVDLRLSAFEWKSPFKLLIRLSMNEAEPFFEQPFAGSNPVIRIYFDIAPKNLEPGVIVAEVQSEDGTSSAMMCGNYMTTPNTATAEKK